MHAVRDWDLWAGAVPFIDIFHPPIDGEALNGWVGACRTEFNGRSAPSTTVLLRRFLCVCVCV